jgi:hypothetical protein
MKILFLLTAFTSIIECLSVFLWAVAFGLLMNRSVGLGGISVPVNNMSFSFRGGFDSNNRKPNYIDHYPGGYVTATYVTTGLVGMNCLLFLVTFSALGKYFHLSVSERH